MPSPVAHLATGAALGYVLPASGRKSWLYWMLFLFLAMLPDIDAVPGLLLGDMGRYHNQYTHSVISGFAFSFLIFLLLRFIQRPRLIFFSLVCLLSYNLHVLMDAMTFGRGVMLFWPFTVTRYSLSPTVFRGLRWSEPLAFDQHLLTLLNESVYVLILWAVIGGMTALTGRIKTSED